MNTYEEKYKKALKNLKSIMKDFDEITISREDMEEVFPELAESEDEKIRKALISFLKSPFVNENITDEHVAPWLAWLEKQNSNVDNANKEYWRGYREGKQEILNKYAELEKQGEEKSSDYENADIQQKGYFASKETVKEVESNLTPLERKVKDVLFSFHINAADGISFDGTMAIVHNLITLCQQEQKPAWSEEDEQCLLACKNALKKYQTTDRCGAVIISRWLEDKLKNKG